MGSAPEPTTSAADRTDTSAIVGELLDLRRFVRRHGGGWERDDTGMHPVALRAIEVISALVQDISERDETRRLADHVIYRLELDTGPWTGELMQARDDAIRRHRERARG